MTGEVGMMGGNNITPHPNLNFSNDALSLLAKLSQKPHLSFQTFGGNGTHSNTSQRPAVSSSSSSSSSSASSSSSIDPVTLGLEASLQTEEMVKAKLEKLKAETTKLQTKLLRFTKLNQHNEMQKQSSSTSSASGQESTDDLGNAAVLLGIANSPRSSNKRSATGPPEQNFRKSSSSSSSGSSSSSSSSSSGSNKRAKTTNAMDVSMTMVAAGQAAAQQNGTFPNLSLN